MVSTAQRLKLSWGQVERREGDWDSSRPRRRHNWAHVPAQKPGSHEHVGPLRPGSTTACFPSGEFRDPGPGCGGQAREDHTPWLARPVRKSP